MKYKIQYLTDAAGKTSNTRVNAHLAVLSALAIAISSVFVDGVTLGDSLPMVIVLLAYSFGVKTFQNIAGVGDGIK